MLRRIYSWVGSKSLRSLINSVRCPAAIPQGVVEHACPPDSLSRARGGRANSFGLLARTWSGWTMRVRDDGGSELFSLAPADFTDSGK
jgi:hypothetical protein